MKNASYKPAVMAEISWTLDDMGVLTISGNGRMPDYAGGKNPAAPWEACKNAIERLVIEDGITEIGINAFRDCRNLKSVKLPQTACRIHAYAFRGCVSLESIESDRSVWRYIYDKCHTADEDTVIFGVESFLDCSWAATKWDNYYLHNGVLYVCFTGDGRMAIPEGYAPAGMRKKKTYLYGDEEMLYLKRVPEFAGKYYLGTEKIKESDGFRRLKIMERKPVFHKDGRITAVWDNDYLDVGKSVLSKIQRGSALVCIKHEAGRVICVKVLAMRHVDDYGEIDSQGIPCVYLMYPEKNDNNVLPWRDSYTYFQTSDVRVGFQDGNGAALAESGRIRFLHPDTHEEWFWCTTDADNWEWSGLAFGALRLWLAAHPEIQVDTQEENMEKDAYRWFVSV